MSLKTKIWGLKEVWQFDNRLWLAVTKTLFRAEKLHVYRYKNLEILIDQRAGDANGAREILTSPMYRRFLPQMAFDGKINLLDLGANNGGFGLLLKSEGVSFKKVVSVELSPRTFTRLRFNLEHNLDCQTIALNAAICGEPKILTVALGAGSVADSIYNSASAEENVTEYVVPGLSFDQIYAEHFQNEIVDVCKMDVEGAEFEIFACRNYQSLRHCRFLIVEIHEYPGNNAADVIAKIKNLGFAHHPPIAQIHDWVHFFANTRLNSNG